MRAFAPISGISEPCQAPRLSTTHAARRPDLCYQPWRKDEHRSCRTAKRNLHPGARSRLCCSVGFPGSSDRRGRLIRGLSRAECPPEFLHALATQSSGQDIWIYCHGHEVALHHAIEMSDFEPRYRVVRTVFLHCFRRTSVSPLLQSAPVEQESSYEPASVLRR